MFGPAELEIRVPEGARGDTVLLASGRPQMVDQLVVSRIDSNHVGLLLTENGRTAVRTGPLPLDHGRLTARLDAPWLYPPAEHPYWDGVPEPERRAIQAGESITSAGQVFSGPLAHAFDADAFEPAIRGPGTDGPSTPWIESFTRLGAGQAGPGSSGARHP